MIGRRGFTASFAAVVALTGCAPDTAREAHDTGTPGSVAATRVVLTEAAFRTAGIEVAEVRLAALEALSRVDVPGQVEADPSRSAFLSARAAGRIERFAAVVGDRVATGDAVAFVTSPAFLTAQHDYQQASRRAARLAATADSTDALALKAAAGQRLQLLGAADSDLAQLERGEDPAPLLPVTAPFGGSIVEALTLAGAAVEAGTPIFRLVDLDEVDIAAQVPERLVPLLRIGQRAAVRVAAFPDRPFAGHVERLKDELDPATRTIAAVIHVANPGHRLRPGMFATVELSAAVTDRSPDAEPEVAVPDAAILLEADGRYVFVAVAERTFERRDVRVIPPPAGLTGASGVVHVRGLRPGERVVVRGAFTIKSELAKAGFAEVE